MSHLPQLTESEIHYICSIIPHQDTIKYFTKNIKEFNKIRPGFRPKSISEAEATRLLINNTKRDFISDFIEKRIYLWLEQIKSHYDGRVDDGDSHINALLHTLPYSVFSENTTLYFKLIGDEQSADHIEILGEAVQFIKEVDDEQSKLHEELKANKSAMEKLKLEKDSETSALNRSKDKLEKNVLEIEALKSKIHDLEELLSDIREDKQKIKFLESLIQLHEKTIKGLKTELSEMKSSRQQLEEQIRVELEKQQNAKVDEQHSAKKPKCPNDLDEFEDYLGYNLENIGVPTGAVYYSLLKAHLRKILFQGIPIVISRVTGMNIMKCVANTLIGKADVDTLVFKKGISVDEVGYYLSSCGRIVCFDNFIGNFNETELLPLFEKYKDRIIFLTVAYDRTMHYISQEFFRYCHYLNVNRIETLSVNSILTEDPSTIAEIDCEHHWLSSESRYARILKGILHELGFPQSSIEQKCSTLVGDQDLNQILAFDILPYCADVLQINPYNISEQLLKYAGGSGRCTYKDLFMGWFA